MHDPEERDLLDWQILCFPDHLARSFKGIHRHCVGERNPAQYLAGWKAGDIHHGPRTGPERALGV